MILQTIYDRLQCDIESIYGFCPQLSVSRVPIYEALWKDLLTRVEWLGAERYPEVRRLWRIAERRNASQEVPVLLGRDSTQLEYGDLDTEQLYEICIGSESERLSALILIPSELVDLTISFLRWSNPLLLRALRQICLFTYKSKSNDITEKQTDTAISGFIARNSACQRLSKPEYDLRGRSDVANREILAIARLLCNIAVDKCDWREIAPSHGPGAVADSKQGYEKWKAIDGRATRLCAKFYPLDSYFSPTPDLYDYSSASDADSICKLAIVPKDKRGPRVICTQPSGLMWIQQGQRRNFERAIETSRILKVRPHSVVGEPVSSIKFDDQDQNGQLALLSSRTRELATIDLSDASDLVSWGLIQFLFNKENLRFLAASRATHVRIDDTQHKLHMFAPMGSAMCFPVESLVFWAIATAASLRGRGVRYRDLVGCSVGFLTNNSSEVYVFGDDIIVRREACVDVCNAYESVGFKPNYRKTFAEGFYRESCGVDAYHGVRLDIARLQSRALTSMSDAYATIELAKRARGMGMFELSEYLECQVESYLGFGLCVGLTDGMFWDRGFPRNSHGQVQAFCWNVRHRRKFRYNRDLQLYEAQTIIASPRTWSPPQDGRYRLFRGLTTGVDEHTRDWLLPDSLQYHLGWVAAF